MASEYVEAQEAQQMADELMKTVHNRLKELKIKCLFKEGPPLQQKGVLLYARVKKVFGLLKYFTDSDFIIEISFDLWKNLNKDAQMAVIDHELCHIVLINRKDGEPKWILQPHDIEEFYEVLERHGCYLKGMERLLSTLKSGKRKSDEWS